MTYPDESLKIIRWTQHKSLNLLNIRDTEREIRYITCFRIVWIPVARQRTLLLQTVMLPGLRGESHQHERPGPHRWVFLRWKVWWQSQLREPAYTRDDKQLCRMTTGEMNSNEGHHSQNAGYHTSSPVSWTHHRQRNYNHPEADHLLITAWK